MRRKRSFTSVTDPKQIAEFARRAREQGVIELAEVFDVITEVLVRKNADGISEIAIPADAVPESMRTEARLAAIRACLAGSRGRRH